MKSNKIALIYLLSVIFFSCSQDKIVELPLTIQNGFSPFHMSLVGMLPIPTDENHPHPWDNIFPRILKFPEVLTDMKYDYIVPNSYQFIYQNYLLGNISEDFYKARNYHMMWEIVDSLSLSRTPIRTELAFVYGKDAEGILKIAVDTNRNLNLNDDELVAVLEVTSLNNSTNQDSLINAHVIYVPFEIFVQNEIISVNTPILFIYDNRNNMLMYGISICATTHYKGEQMAVSSVGSSLYQYENQRGVLQLAFINDLKEGERVRQENIYRKDDYIEIKNKIYKIIGVNVEKHTLVLEKIDLPKRQFFTTQVGFKPHPFQGEEITTKSSISLESFKGKYVLLDFWAEWCGPCIAEFPHLKELYAKTDRKKFEIIGIAGSSSFDGIKRLIEQHEITWPQILSDDTNKITEMYGIQEYPTTFLIDTEGIIISKNLRGKELEDKILSLIKK